MTQEEGPEDSGRFVYDPSEKDKVYLGKESFYTVDPSPQNWIDKDFIKPEADQRSYPGFIRYR